ncbi:hypothetical protein PoB_002658000 [Plakobranchus ocellatus]|uniref:Uncharacterized protein n=1 Tax=Plakobranchus ocellatus TaxID=259542 RepID=A0AAV3ZZI0_9GAST|nr:hypothetical protein PoB_002658000 [Plakobranchus ocellatus]
MDTANRTLSNTISNRAAFYGTALPGILVLIELWPCHARLPGLCRQPRAGSSSRQRQAPGPRNLAEVLTLILTGLNEVLRDSATRLVPGGRRGKMKICLVLGMRWDSNLDLSRGSKLLY